MTAGSARRREPDRKAISAVQTYLTSLMYLRQEASRDGLEAVAAIIWNALTALEAWLDTGESPVNSSDVLDTPLCQSLDFLFTWLSLQPARRQEIAREITRYETPASAARTVARTARRANKRKVSSRPESVPQ